MFRSVRSEVAALVRRLAAGSPQGGTGAGLAYRSVNDVVGEARVLGDLANALHELGDHDETLRYAQHAVEELVAAEPTRIGPPWWLASPSCPNAPSPVSDWSAHSMDRLRPRRRRDTP